MLKKIFYIFAALSSFLWFSLFYFNLNEMYAKIIIGSVSAVFIVAVILLVFLSKKENVAKEFKFWFLLSGYILAAALIDFANLKFEHLFVVIFVCLIDLIISFLVKTIESITQIKKSAKMHTPEEEIILDKQNFIFSKTNLLFDKFENKVVKNQVLLNKVLKKHFYLTLVLVLMVLIVSRVFFSLFTLTYSFICITYLTVLIIAAAKFVGGNYARINK